MTGKADAWDVQLLGWHELTKRRQLMARASREFSWLISWLSCVCRSLSFFFSPLRHENRMVSGLSDPMDSTLKKNLFGLPLMSKGACAEKDSKRSNYLKLKAPVINYIALRKINAILSTMQKHINRFEIIQSK